MIRSAPAPESGPSMVPLVAVLVVIVALAGGAYYYTQRNNKPPEVPKSTEPAPVGENAPDFVMEKVLFYENEGRLEEALTYALEKEKDYPAAPDLKAKIRELREKLYGSAQGNANPDEALTGLAKRVEAKQYQEALDGLDNLAASTELTDAQDGRLAYIQAQAHIGLGNMSDAAACLDQAAEKGHPQAEIDALRAQLKE